jgi:hypothetical protein
MLRMTFVNHVAGEQEEDEDEDADGMAALQSMGDDQRMATLRALTGALAGGEIMGFDEQGMPILASEYDSDDDSDYLSEDEDDEGEG